MLGSLLLGHLRGVDIRTQGSGNAGGTNALRTQGKWFALGVIVDRRRQGACSRWACCRALRCPGIGIDATIDREWLAVACAVAVVVGHVYPVWYEFRGGKGAATMLGAVAMLAPAALVPVLAVWFADGDAHRLCRARHDARHCDTAGVLCIARAATARRCSCSAA